MDVGVVLDVVSRHWSLLLEVGRHDGFGGHGCGRLCGSGMIWGGK